MGGLVVYFRWVWGAYGSWLGLDGEWRAEE